LQHLNQDFLLAAAIVYPVYFYWYRLLEEKFCEGSCSLLLPSLLPVAKLIKQFN